MTPEHDRICYLCGKPGGNPAAWSLGELGGRGKFAHAGCVARHQRRLGPARQRDPRRRPEPVAAGRRNKPMIGGRKP